MTKLTVEYGQQLIDSFKQKARKCIERRRYDDAIAYIRAAAWINYDFYIGYTDDELEYYLSHISRHVIPRRNYEKKESDGIVLIDAFSMDTQGLSAQYINAIISTGSRLLYIHRNDIGDQSTLYQALISYPKSEIIKVPKKLGSIEQAKWIYTKIMDFGATNVLLHLLPNSATECIALYALPKEIIRFQINLTDHAFWLGTKCSDYTIEFQQIGCSLSYKERGYKLEQILLLPFYPIINNRPFEGFPTIVNDAIKIFSGGAYYKVLDPEDTFFKLCKKLLDNNPNAVILFATNDSQDVIKRKVEQYGISHKFFILPFRKDIAAVFENIDIFLNTYPVGGGLMCQYAANYAVPILNYQRSSMEESVGQKYKVSFTSLTENSLVQESIKLCNDPAYRKEKGIILKNAVISPDDFNTGFQEIIRHKTSPFKLDFNSVNYTRDQIAKITSLNASNAFNVRILSILGFWRSLLSVPQILLCEAPDILLNKIRLFFQRK